MRLKTTVQIITFALSCACTNADRAAELADTSDASIDEALTQAKASLVTPNSRQDLCLTALDKDQADGSRLTLSKCDSADLQLFRPINSGALVTQSGKCLDVTDGKDVNGTPVQLWACASNNTNQRWETGDEGILRWKGKNKCLDIVDGNFETGAKLQIWDCDIRNKNQLWRFTSPVGKARTIESGTILAQANSFDAELLSVPRTAGEGFTQSGSQTVGSLYKAGLCLDVHDIETSPYIQLYTCNNSRSQRFNLSGTGAVQFPPEDVMDSKKNIIKINSYCLSTDDLGKDQGFVASIKPCDPKNEDQSWARTENAFVHLKSKKCLGIDAWGNTSNNQRYLPLVDCTRSPAIRWSVGTKEDHELNKKKELEALDIPSASRLWVQVIDRSGASDELRTNLAMYGGPDALAQWVAAQYVKNNQIAYTEGAQIPSKKLLKLVFDRYPGMAGTTGRSYNSEMVIVFVNFGWSKGITKEALLGTLAHELTHVGQYSYGLPGGLVEGFANYMSDVAYQPRGQKSKGGSWKDGYDQAKYFLFWLDQTYPSPKDPKPFSLRMNLQARTASLTQDGGWFTTWLRAETGQDIDSLWANYQKSF